MTVLHLIEGGEKPITAEQVRVARNLLRDGYSLIHAAEVMGLSARALDIALWRFIGERI